MTYETTPKQEQAIRDWLQEAIVPLIEQVLVKKLGQAMSFAAEQVVEPKRKPLTDDQCHAICDQIDAMQEATAGDYAVDFVRAIEAAHGIKGQS